MAKKKNAAQRRAEQEKQRKSNWQEKPKQAASSAPGKRESVPRKRDSVSEVQPVYEKISAPRLEHKPAAKLADIDLSKDFMLRVGLLSPLHLGSGQADVNVDAQIIHDKYGLPYFPGRRLKGLLYESGVEVAEMAELSGLPLFTGAQLDELFQRGSLGQVQLDLSNLYLEGSEEMRAEWGYLEERYPGLFRPEDVLESYTSLRYQTKIDAETGTAADTSLHNMQVLDEGLIFTGSLSLKNGDMKSLAILALALRNLTQAGLKRSRGFGHLACTLEQGGRDVMLPLIAWAAAEAKEGMANG